MSSAWILISLILSCTLMSRKTAMLVSAMGRRTGLGCPHCGEATVNPARADYFIPTLARHTCSACGGQYRRERRTGVVLLAAFAALALGCLAAPPPAGCSLFPVGCLVLLVTGVMTYRPIAAGESPR